MRVFIPDPLRSYTKGEPEVEARGSTLNEVLVNLDQQYRGIRFRIIDEQDAIRRHIRIFVNSEQARSLTIPLGQTDEIIIVQALSGG